MRKRVVAAVAAAALALAGASAAALAQSSRGQELRPSERGAYVAVAGAHDLYQIRSAELALQKSQRPEVREYAQTMLTEHRRSSQRFAEAVRAVGLEELLPPAMMPMHWDMLRRLERAGSRFDRTYVRQQIDMHEIAVELHRNFAANGNDPQLKPFAEAAVPVVSGHLERARRLEP